MSEESYELVFASEDTLESVYLTILEKQGFLGDLIQQYRSVKIIGHGNQGKVWLVQHKFSHLHYAMKVFDEK